MIKKSFWLEDEQAKWIMDATKATNKKLKLVKLTESAFMRDVIDIYRGSLIKSSPTKVK